MFSIPATVAPVSMLLILAGYLLGSLSGRRLLDRMRIDAAATEGPNLLQSDGRGPRWGAAAIDAGKSALAVWLALRYAPIGDPLSVTAHGYLAAVAAMLGHIWPLWHGFRGGGQGAAALAGALLVLWPLAAVAALIVGLLALLSSGYLGLATVLAAFGLPLLAWWSGADPPRLGFALTAALLLLFTHRGHLARLRAGTESRFALARWLHRWRRG